MAQKIVVFDDTTGQIIASTTLIGAVGGASSFVDQSYDVGGGGQATFVVSQAFTGLSKIDVFVNGRLQREGASHDYQRDTDNNEIDFNYTVPENAWVLVRVY